MGPLGIPELIMIFIVALVVFGPKKLPELGKSLGRGLREFNKAKNELKATWDEQIREAENSIQTAKETIHEPVRETIAAVNSVNEPDSTNHELTHEPHAETPPAAASGDHPNEPPIPPSHGN